MTSELTSLTWELKQSDIGANDHSYYNGASMIVNNTPKGIMFKDLPRAIVIFIMR